jgi:D-serine deaminase-like pyridoxal phosphate-dependent protein
MIQGLLDDTVMASLDTPVLVADIDRVDARIATMAALMADRGVALRPHAKTHKSVEFGRRQIEAGAVGLTVATIGEAEVFAEAGFDDLFIAYPVIAQGPKATRLRDLAERCTLSVGADSLAGLESLARAMAGATRRLSVVIEIDTGGARTGVHPALAGGLAREAEALGLRTLGAFTHGGHGYAGADKRERAGADEVVGLEAAAASFTAEGLEAGVVSAGSTPTAEFSARSIVTEERPGMYVFGDRQEAALAGKPFEEAALMIAATVVSLGSGDGFVIDAGAKVLGKDIAPYLQGHGSVLGHPGAVIDRVNDHHGVVTLPAGAARPAIGTVVWVLPNHACPVVNLVDQYVIARGGQVVDRWPVDARGRNS